MESSPNKPKKHSAADQAKKKQATNSRPGSSSGYPLPAPSDRDVPMDIFADRDNIELELMWLPCGVVLFVILIMAFGIAYVKGFKTYLAAQHWPSTPGYVEIARLHEREMPMTDQVDENGTPEIQYAYVVDGQRYQCTQIAMDGLGNNITDYLNGKKTLPKYPVNQPVKVYYSPRDPSFATLELRWVWDPEVDTAAKVMAVLTFLLILTLIRYSVVKPRLARIQKQVARLEKAGEL